MLSNLRTPLVAAVILVLAFAGTATAAKLVTGKQVKNNSLTGKDIKNGSVKPADLSAGAKQTLTGPKGEPGAPGAKGDTGAPGAKGDTGASGPPVGFMGRANGLDTGIAHTEFGYLNTVGAASDDAGTRTTLTPDVELRATKLVARVSAAPDSMRRFTLRVNGDDTDLDCIVAADQTTCSNDTAVTIPPSSEVSMRMFSGLVGNPAADALYAVTLERP